MQEKSFQKISFLSLLLSKVGPIAGYLFYWNNREIKKQKQKQVALSQKA